MPDNDLNYAINASQNATAAGLSIAQQAAGLIGGPTASTVANGIERLEKLATSYGPTALSLVADLADALGGPQNAKDGASSQNPPSPSHLAARLHSVASVLEGLLSGISMHAQRASRAAGTNG